MDASVDAFLVDRDLGRMDHIITIAQEIVLEIIIPFQAFERAVEKEMKRCAALFNSNIVSDNEGLFDRNADKVISKVKILTTPEFHKVLQDIGAIPKLILCLQNMLFLLKTKNFCSVLSPFC